MHQKKFEVVNDDYSFALPAVSKFSKVASKQGRLISSVETVKGLASKKRKIGNNHDTDQSNDRDILGIPTIKTRKCRVCGMQGHTSNNCILQSIHASSFLDQHLIQQLLQTLLMESKYCTEMRDTRCVINNTIPTPFVCVIIKKGFSSVVE